METTQLIMLMGGGIGSLALGALAKKIKQIPNELIPLINGVVFSLLFATLGKLGFTMAAVLTGMGAAYGATTVYELKKAMEKPVTTVGGGQ